MGGALSGSAPWRRAILALAVPNPAAAADWSYTVPAGQVLRIGAAYGILTTAGASGRRLPRLTVTDGIATIVDVPPAGAVTNNVTHRYLWMPNGSTMQPVASFPDNALAAAVATTAAGTALSYVLGVNANRRLTTATWVLLAGTPPTMALQLVRGATTYNLWRGSAGAILSLDIPLTDGDTVQWQTITGGVGSSGDFTINVEPADAPGWSNADVVAIPELTLLPGWTIGTTTDNLQAVDQWSALRILVTQTTMAQGPIDIGELPELVIAMANPTSP